MLPNDRALTITHSTYQYDDRAVVHLDINVAELAKPNEIDNITGYIARRLRGIVKDSVIPHFDVSAAANHE